MKFNTEKEAIDLLVKRKYEQLKDYTWKLPSPAHVMLLDEQEAALYLMNEWDWGGVHQKGKDSD